MFKLIVIIILAHGTSQQEYEFNSAEKCNAAARYYNAKPYRDYLEDRVGRFSAINITANCWEK
jgi:hypothetical protein